jgi:ribonuclease D
MVATNRQLIEWSISMAEGKSIKLPRHFRNGRIARFKEMEESVRELPKAEWPKRPVTKRRKRNSEFDQRVDEMLKHRNNVAEELEIDGSLIASRAVVEAIAAKENEPSELLMNWQRDLLGV